MEPPPSQTNGAAQMDAKQKTQTSASGEILDNFLTDSIQNDPRVTVVNDIAFDIHQPPPSKPPSVLAAKPSSDVPEANAKPAAAAAVSEPTERKRQTQPTLAISGRATQVQVARQSSVPASRPPSPNVAVNDAQNGQIAQATMQQLHVEPVKMDAKAVPARQDDDFNPRQTQSKRVRIREPAATQLFPEHDETDESDSKADDNKIVQKLADVNSNMADVQTAQTTQSMQSKGILKPVKPTDTRPLLRANVNDTKSDASGKAVLTGPPQKAPESATDYAMTDPVFGHHVISSSQSLKSRGDSKQSSAEARVQIQNDAQANGIQANGTSSGQSGQSGLNGRAATRPDPVPQKKATSLTPRNGCFASLVGIVLLVLVLFFVVEFPKKYIPSANDGVAIPELWQLCLRKNPMAETYMFSLIDPQSNDTHVVYVDRYLNAQVTNVLRHGSLIYTEAIDFNQKRMAIYPEGAVSPGTSQCINAPVGSMEQNWGDIACAERLSIKQMKFIGPVIPTELPSSFFTVPLTCPRWSVSMQDVTTEEEASILADVETKRALLTNITLLPDVLRDLMSLMQKQFGPTHIENPALSKYISASYDRFGEAFLETELSSIFAPPVEFNRTRGNSSECCGKNRLCLEQLELHPTGLGAICQSYSDCVAEQDLLWYKAHLVRENMGSWPFETCDLAEERRCHCDYRLATAMDTAGNAQCGDCLEDESNCDCYVMSWLIRYVAQSRPCWCQGTCMRESHLYICDAKKACDGLFDTDCRVELTWCPRSIILPCVHCHMEHQNDEDDHC